MVDTQFNKTMQKCLSELLAAHDWTYEMCDDAWGYQRGVAQELIILKVIHILGPAHVDWYNRVKPEFISELKWERVCKAVK